MRLFYSADYVASGHEFDTTRKAKWIADSLEQSPIPGVEIVAPLSLTAEQLATVHDPAYVEMARTGQPTAEANSRLAFPWDSAQWRMVTASNGGAVSAALAAMTDGVSGSLSSGLHHARRDRGTGFCTFNGLALAARAALANGGTSVLILDLDAHCGGGTASLIEDDPRIWQLDVSVSSFDSYASSARSRLEVVRDSALYLKAITRGLDDLAHILFDLCIYNAGMDPFEGCVVGGLHGVDGQMLAEREDIVFTWCEARRLPVAFVLAGGYVGDRLTEPALVDLHRLTLSRSTAQALQR